ncbi:hypothetical protein J9303_15910 [Bacillaceae bacterium Marseille-Q3522]|nr:hypothetical protein [Bacillaceae bacterium Marseille-Q3522]
MLQFLSLSLVTPSFAEYNENKGKAETINEQNSTIYKYEYNGIEFSGDTVLTQDQLKNMYNDVFATTNSLGGEIMVLDPGSGQVRVVGPVYRTYSNATFRAVADFITFYTVMRAPRPIRTSAFGAWVLNKIQGWVKIIQPTYVGSWVTSSWSNWHNKRVYHETLVHYANSNYTQPTKVQYYDVTNWWE